MGLLPADHFFGEGVLIGQERRGSTATAPEIPAQFAEAVEEVGPSAGPPQPYAPDGRNEAFRPGYTAKNELIRPVGWREWPFVGRPVTANGLNPPEAPFPEFHIVYMDPAGFDHYRRTGTFKDGTMLVKELTRVQRNDTSGDGGSTQESSGRGYFMGEYAGLEATVKDSKRFADQPGNWAYFTFGHVPEAKYAALKTAEPADTCNVCHQANAADDFVFTQHYPVLQGLKSRVRG